MTDTPLTKAENAPLDQMGLDNFAPYLMTEKGGDAYARLWPHMAEAYGAMFKGIDAAEKEAFVATLRTMLRNIRKHDF